MAQDKLSILIQALLDVSNSQEAVNKGVKELQKNVPKINIKANIDKESVLWDKTLGEDLKTLERKIKIFTNEQGQLVKETKFFAQEVNEAGESYTVLKKKTEEIISDYKKLRQELEKQDKLEKNIAMTVANKIRDLQTQATILKTNYEQGDFSQLDKFTSQLEKQRFTSENYKNILNELSNEYKKLASSVKESHAANVTATKDQEKQITQYNKLSNELKKLQNNAQSTNTILKNFGGKEHHIKADKLTNSLNKLNISQDMTQKEMEETIAKARQLSNSLNNVSKEAKATGNNSMTFGKMLSTAAEKFTVWIGVTTVFFATVRAIKSGIDSIIELDDALVELRKVTNLTSGDLKTFTNQASEVAERVARTTAEVTKATAMFARMGFTVQESLNLAEWANVLTNVGDGINSVEDASTSIISTLKGFGMEASNVQKIIDSLNEVSNNFALSTSDLSEGIRRVSATLSSAGNTFDETIGILTAAIEVIQNAPRAATGIRTIALRLRGVTEEGEEIAELVPKLEKNFQKFGITLKKSNGQFKSTYEILQDLAKVRNKMSDFEFAEISELVSGKRQSDILNAILMNINSATAAMETSANSFGSALKEQEAYLDSITAKTNKFKQAVQDMWQNTISSNTIKGVVDLGTALVNLTDKIGLLTVGLAGLWVYLSLSGKLAMTIPIFDGLAMATGRWAVSANLGATATTALATAVSTLLPLLIAGGLIIGIRALINAHDNYIKKLNENVQTIEETIDKHQKETDSLDKLAKEYNKLLQKTDKTIEEKKKFNELNDQLIKTYPELNTYVDTEGKLLYITAEALEEANNQRKESIRLKKQDLLSTRKEILQSEIQALRRRSLASGAFLGSALQGNIIGGILNAEYIKMTKESLEKLIDYSKIYRDEILSIEKDLGNVSEFSETALLKISDVFIDEFVPQLHNGTVSVDDFEKKWRNLISSLNTPKVNNALEKFEKATSSKNIDEIKLAYNRLDDVLKSSTGSIISIVDMFGTLNDVIKRSIERAKTIDELNDEFEKFNETTDNTFDSLTSLSNAYNTLSNGEKISLENVIELVKQYPKLANYINETNDLTFDRGNIVKQVWEIEKAIELQRLEVQEKQLENEYALQEALLKRTDITALYSGQITPEMKKIREQLKLNRTLQNLYSDAGIYDFSGKTPSSTSALSPIPYEDLTKELIKSYNAEVERDKIAEKLLNKQIKQAEKAKDYNKAIELQNKLLDNQQKTIADLQKANQKIHEEANRLRSTSKYDTTSWFDNNGEMTLAYKELLNSFAGKTDEFSKKEKESIEDLFNKLSLLKKGWYENADAIDTYTENMYQSQQQIESYKKSLEDLAEEELKRIQDQHKALQSQADEKLKLYSDTEKEIINLLKKRYDEEQKLRQRNYNDAIKKLDDEKKAYQDYINEKIDSLDREYSTDDYNQNVSDQTKVIADIQKEIDKFTLAATTGDMEAISKVADLRKQKAEEERKLTEIQTKRSRDLQKQNLQDNLKDYEKYIDTKKRAEEDAFEQYKRNLQDMTEETALKLEAQQMLMEKSLVDVQNALIDLFTVTNTNATETGRILQDQIISRLERIRDIGSNINEISQQSSGNNPLGMNQADFRKYVNNKKEFETGNPSQERIRQLMEENERLRKKYGIKGDFYSYKQLVGYYKDGGINITPGLAMLHGTPSKPEWILNTDQMKKLINNLAFSNVAPKIPSYNNLSGSKGSTIQISNLINVEGNATEDVIPQIKSAGMNIVNQLKGWGVVIPNG